MSNVDLEPPAIEADQKREVFYTRHWANLLRE
jgi:hypothetical protein